MKVILVNGSPHKSGCTACALDEVRKTLEKEGIETEIFWIGTSVQNCIGCRQCALKGKCVFDDNVNEFIEKAKTADGFVFGTPVYYGSAAGGIKSFMDRAFYSGSRYLADKPAATLVSCRRGGAAQAFSQLNMFYTINNMPVVSSQYWNQVHGNTPEEVMKDEEGMQTMRTLAVNMAWMLKALSKEAKPEREKPVKTNFIR